MMPADELSTIKRMIQHLAGLNRLLPPAAAGAALYEERGLYVDRNTEVQTDVAVAVSEEAGSVEVFYFISNRTTPQIGVTEQFEAFENLDMLQRAVTRVRDDVAATLWGFTGYRGVCMYRMDDGDGADDTRGEGFKLVLPLPAVQQLIERSPIHVGRGLWLPGTPEDDPSLEGDGSVNAAVDAQPLGMGLEVGEIDKPVTLTVQRVGDIEHLMLETAMSTMPRRLQWQPEFNRFWRSLIVLVKYVRAVRGCDQENERYRGVQLILAAIRQQVPHSKPGTVVDRMFKASAHMLDALRAAVEVAVRHQVPLDLDECLTMDPLATGDAGSSSGLSLG